LQRHASHAAQKSQKRKMPSKWTKTLVEDPDNPGELLLYLDGIAEELGWQVGDTLQWTDNQDGTYSLSKIQHEPGQS